MEILILVGLILLNGLFSMSEMALVSARKFKLETAARKGDKNAKKALDISGNPSGFLSTVQIGITLIGILVGIYSGENLTEPLAQKFTQIAWLEPYAEIAAVTIVVIAVTFVSIVLGELTPKQIGLTFPEGIARYMAYPMYYLSVAVKPFVWLLSGTNNLLLGIFGVKALEDSRVTEEEIKAIISEGKEGGEIREIEQEIVERVFSLGDRKINDIMTHRTDLEYFRIQDSLEEVLKKVEGSDFSYYPVIDRNIDDVVGVISTMELLAKARDKANFSLQTYLKTPHYLPETIPAYQLLESFKSSRQHYAIVVDEFGSTQGIVTIDDILDALVGDVSEAHYEEYGIKERNDNSWLVDGLLSVHEFINYFDLPVDVLELGEIKTVGGLFIYQLNAMPRTGDKIRFSGLDLEVIDMDGKRVDKVLVTKIEEA